MVNDEVINLHNFMSTSDFAHRWKEYRRLQEIMPNVRNLELKETLSLINPNPQDKILEIGTGSGYLTIPLASLLGKTGKLVTADINKHGLDKVSNIAKQNSLPIEVFNYCGDYHLKKKFVGLNEKSFDKICSLATFHHFDTRGDDNSSFEDTKNFGRTSLLKESYDILKDGGEIIIVDVLNNSISQKYFDAIDDPIHFFPIGHPHNFFSKTQMRKALQEAGFSEITIEIKSVPWKFNNIEDAKIFYHTFHQSLCPIQESFDIAKKILGFKKLKNSYFMNWELGFIRGIKKVN